MIEFAVVFYLMVLSLSNFIMILVYDVWCLGACKVRVQLGLTRCKYLGR